MTIRELYFASSLVCIVAAGFALILTAMWIMAWISSPKQTGSARAVCFSGAATLVFALVGFWLLLRAGILFL
jgi:hypothetical protein